MENFETKIHSEGEDINYMRALTVQSFTFRLFWTQGHTEISLSLDPRGVLWKIKYMITKEIRP